MLLGLLLPDPCDPLRPEDFRHKARRLLPQVGCGDGETDEKLRHGLLKFIGDFANWDLSLTVRVNKNRFLTIEARAWRRSLSIVQSIPECTLVQQ